VMVYCNISPNTCFTVHHSVMYSIFGLSYFIKSSIDRLLATDWLAVGSVGLLLVDCNWLLCTLF